MPRGAGSLYSPVEEVLPSAGGASLGYQNIHVNPDQFGASVGRAQEKLGNTLENTGTVLSQIALKQQGMINETLATDAETEYVTALGERMNKFRSKEGLAASADLPATINDITEARNQIKNKLTNPAAQRAFDTLSRRHQAFAIRDANAYASSQIKQADFKSAQAAQLASIGQAGSFGVADDDERFSATLGDIDFATRRMMQNQGWDGHMSEGPDGALKFNDTPEGQQAKSVYDYSIGHAQGQAWENRLKTLSTRNVQSAYDIFQKNKGSIPGETQAKMEAYFAPKLRDAQTRVTADGILSEVERNYKSRLNPTSTGNGGVKAPPETNDNMERRAPETGDTINRAILQQESGNSNSAPTSVNGAVGPAQIKPSTFAQYAKPGEDINNPEDNRRVGNRIIDDLKQKYPDDPARVAVGYFSGPGNVAPPGSPTPWVNDTKDGNGKSVSSYVADVTKRMGGTGESATAQPPTGYQSRAAYYRANEAQILEQTRARAVQEHPDDPAYQDLVVARVQQRMGAVIRAEDAQKAAYNEAVLHGLTGQMSNGRRPISMDELRALGPQVSQGLDWMMVNNPQAYMNIEQRVLTAAAKESDHDLKTYGKDFYSVLNRIHAQPGTDDRITDVSQLYGMVGHGLTMAGLDKAKAEIAGRGTPDGVAMSDLKKGAMAYARHQLTFEADFGSFKLRDPKGEDDFNVKFLPAFYQAYDAGIKAGKTPYDLLSKNSPDFIVDKLVSAYKRSPAQWMKDRVEAGVETNQVTPDKGAKVPPPKVPDIGEVMDGYRFKGGNPADPKAWEEVDAKPAVPVR